MGETYRTRTGEVAKHDRAESLLREAQVFATIAEICPAVLGRRVTAVLAQNEAHGIVDLIAIVEDTTAFELLHQRALAEFVGRKIPVPKKQVVNGAHQAAASHEVVAGGPVDQELAVLARILGGRAIRDDQRVVIEKERVLHP